MRNLTEKEFNEKYELYKDIIYNIAYTYVHNKDDALDISQEVFIKYLNSDEIFDSLNNEKYWIIRVTINTCKNDVTSSWKKKVVLNNDYIDLATIEEERKERFNYYEIITSLPNKYKEAIVLFYYEDLSIEEIANVLLVSSSCVKKRLERGRQMIKKEIENGKKA